MPKKNIVSDVQSTNENDQALLTKEMIENAVKNAVENVIAEKEQEDIIEDPELLDDSEVIIDDSEEDFENLDEDPDVIDTDVTEVVDEEVKEQIDLLGDFNFLGIDVHIEKNDDDKYNVTLTKDETVKEDTLDDISLQAIFDEINAFFDEWAIDDTKEDTEDDSEEDISDLNEDEEDLDDFEDLDLEELEESNKSLTSSINIDSLMEKYSSDINDIFEHGLEAKQIALDMVKETILANSIRELIDKSKAKDKLIANKQKELKKSCNDYILARDMNNKYNQVYNTLVANINDVKEDLTKGLISEKVANKTLERYNAIISKVLEAKKVETLVASLKIINKTKAGLVAYKKENSKSVIANKNIIGNTKPVVIDYDSIIAREKAKQQKNSIVSSRNVYNREGMKEQTLSSRHNGISTVDRMTAEICSIAGL